MLFLICKGYNLSLYTWAISRTDTLYLAIVEGRIGERGAKYLVAFGRSIENMARQLTQGIRALCAVRKVMEVTFVAFLLCGKRPVYTTPIDTSRGTGLHPIGAAPYVPQLLGESIRSGFTNAPTRYHGTPKVHHSSQKSSYREHYRARVELFEQQGFNSNYSLVFYE